MRTERYQNVHLGSDQVGDQPMEMVTQSFRPSVLNGQALLFNIPKLSHALAKSGKEWPFTRSAAAGRRSVLSDHATLLVDLVDP